jgi:hypothetical protein
MGQDENARRDFTAFAAAQVGQGPVTIPSSRYETPAQQIAVGILAAEDGYVSRYGSDFRLSKAILTDGHEAFRQAHLG